MGNKEKYIIVIGSNGQLGSCIKEVYDLDNPVKFLTHYDIEISDYKSIDSCFNNIGVDNIFAVINCAAYKNCELAEINKEIAYNINVVGSKNLAKICSKNNIKLIHISTDFVSPRNQNTPLKNIQADPELCFNVYGRSKCEGENEIIREYKSNMSNNYCIVRTSWLYSEYQSNFLKSVLKKITDGDELSVVDDQIGSPTYAIDLANFIIRHIIIDNIDGIISYRNNGVCSWYDFAKCIEMAYSFYHNKYSDKISPCSESITNVSIKRPNYSVLDIRETEKYCRIPYWQDSVYKCVGRIFVNEK